MTQRYYKTIKQTNNTKENKGLKGEAKKGAEFHNSAPRTTITNTLYCVV